MFGLGSTEIILLVGIFLFFQWIIMLIDAIHRPQELYKYGSKTIWIILLILFGQPTAIVYYFTNRRGNLIPKKTT